jgi:cell wall assembly regulator SMI1
MAGFVEKGWLAMSTPLDDEVVFLCPKCAKGQIREAEKDLGIQLSPQSKRVFG